MQKNLGSQHPKILRTHQQNTLSNRRHLQLPNATHEKLPSMGLILNTHNLRPLPFLFTGRYHTDAEPNLQSCTQQPPRKAQKQNTRADANMRRHKDTRKHITEKQSGVADVTDKAMGKNDGKLEQTRSPALKSQAEIKDVQKMRETFRETHNTLTRLKNQVDKLEERIIFAPFNESDAKPVRSDPSICPHCGFAISSTN